MIAQEFRRTYPGSFPASDVVLDARRDKSDLRHLVFRDTRGRVERDRVAARSAAHRRSRRARSGCHVQRWRRRPLAAMLSTSPDVVEHRADVEPLGVIAQAAERALQAPHEYTRSEWWYRRSDSTLRISSVASRAIRLSGNRRNGRGFRGRSCFWPFQALSAFAGPRATARGRGVQGAGARRRCSGACAATYTGGRLIARLRRGGVTLHAWGGSSRSRCEPRCARGWAVGCRAPPHQVRRHDRASTGGEP
jgi:hypothetical protein